MENFLSIKTNLLITPMIIKTHGYHIVSREAKKEVASTCPDWT